jgi:hypothetical protein
MKVYRLRFVKILFITVWCTALLHMTFFLAEVTLLGLEKNKALVENAKKLLACVSVEEEPDAHSSSGESRSVAKALDFLDINLLHSLNANRSTTILFKFLSDEEEVCPGHIVTFSPPPDARS